VPLTDLTEPSCAGMMATMDGTLSSEEETDELMRINASGLRNERLW